MAFYTYTHKKDGTVELDGAAIGRLERVLNPGGSVRCFLAFDMDGNPVKTNGTLRSTASHALRRNHEARPSSAEKD